MSTNPPDFPVLNLGPRTGPDGRRIRYGGCICGAVRFEVRGSPIVVGICHCLECRKATGADAMPYADWHAKNFSVTGLIRTFVGRSFCPECGTRLFNLNRDRVSVMLGSLDDAPGDLHPVREGWILRREPWRVPVRGALQFERDVQ
ncbi:GFA family protein [Devosia sp. UYZn731]|uniref:GFA family protein n=1 Tax=Devosia sp. UYZn731 TaxID=3156345 RepID=UPI003395AF47